MKRCAECGRDYNDDSLSFCLDDGSELLYGPARSDPAAASTGGPHFDVEPQTAILREIATQNEAPTRAQIHETDAAPRSSLGELSDAQRPGAFGATNTFGKGASGRLLTAIGIGVLLIAGGLFGYRYFRSGPTQIESIAVMPFVNESGNADVEYLSDGMTDTLISSLSKISDLSVKARSAVFAYKGRDVSPKQVADELGVQAVLLGRLVQRGESIKLNLELVNADTLDVIWSEQYDRRQADLLNLQTEIARDVSSKLNQKLTGIDQQTIAKSHTKDTEAYRLYLLGRFSLNKRVGKEYQMAETYLQQAVARDPNFALAYVGLAEFLQQSDRPRAKEYILRALAIDPELPDARAALGIQYALDHDWAASERELKRAIELDPKNARSHSWNGARAMMIGRYDECLAAFDRAVALEPTLPDMRGNRGACLVAAGRVDEGIAEVRKSLEIDPTYPWGFSHLSFLLRMTGDKAGSVEARARSAELLDRPDLAARFREAYRSKGWEGYLIELLDQTRDAFTNRTRKASILAELGRPDEALASLEEGLATGDWWLFSIKYDPAFDRLREHPRFVAVLKKFDPPK